jgi:pimeloyl-ACP methyl ester carboxylesterase
MAAFSGFNTGEIWNEMRIVRTILFCIAVWTPLVAHGAMHQVRVPLDQGRLSVDSLTQGLAKLLHAPILEVNSDVSIDLNGLRGVLWIKAMNAALGEGCQINAEPDALVLSADPEKLPSSLREIKQAVRLFTATAAPQATADQQQQYGLHLPQHLSSGRPLVVLVHGLDCDGSDWREMAELLGKADYQVGYFRYPNDEPLKQSAASFGQQMQALRETFPKLTVDVVTHSMGAMIARYYIEGGTYAGGIRHLVLIAPPNHGSPWAILSPILELHEHYELWRHNPKWHWTWMITDGLGEAGVDLEPHSTFLSDLNERPRRPGVRYTIIAGDHTPFQKWESSALKAVDRCIPDAVGDLWGLRQCREKISRLAEEIQNESHRSDGVVSIRSAELHGVSDVVILPVDHQSLYFNANADTRPPAAWPILADRLAQ